MAIVSQFLPIGIPTFKVDRSDSSGPSLFRLTVGGNLQVQGVELVGLHVEDLVELVAVVTAALQPPTSAGGGV